MARHVGFIGNRPDLGPRAVELESHALRVRRAQDVSAGWGIGFYQGGEILLKRRPVDERPELRFEQLAGDARGDILIGHIRAADAAGAALCTENTQPFRYRQWLFAQTGTVKNFSRIRGRLVDSLPKFLVRDVRGDTDGELLFHLFLSFVHDAGQLDRPAIAPPDTRSAIRSSLALLDRLCAEEGDAPSPIAVLIATPNELFGICRGRPMGYRVFAGALDVERLFGASGLGRLRLPDLASCKVTLVASDFEDDRVPTGWTLLNERAIVTLTRAHDPEREPL